MGFRLFYVVLLFVQMLALFGGIALCMWQLIAVIAIRKELRHRSFLIAFHGLSVLLACAFVCVGLTLLPVALNPDGYLLDRRYGDTGNEKDALTVQADKFLEDAICICDIPYADDFPNSFFDLYTADTLLDAPASVFPRPVFIYVHGGGYYTGDKALDDPDSMGPGCRLLFEEMLDAGYAVVSMNYALAPEYGYPTPVVQMGQLVSYLKAHAGELGLDMSRVIVGGGSAGGQIAGQYAAIQTDDAYAREVGVEQELSDGQIRAVYLGCALIDPELFSAVDDSSTSYFFFQMQRGYFGNPGTGKAREADLLDHVTGAYPPTYLTDGNAATFDMQAHELERRLHRLGVPCDSFIFERGSAELVSHGYDVQKDEGPAFENVRRFMTFLHAQGLA